MSADTSAAAGQRRPQPEDLQPLLEKVADGKSLREACRILGLHAPSTSDWLHDDEDRREQYVRAREMRAEHYQEEGLTVTKAAALGLQVGGKKVDPAGARVYLEAIKWATARMAPKSAPVQRHAHSFEDLSDEELEARIREKMAIAGASSVADEPPSDA